MWSVFPGKPTSLTEKVFFSGISPSSRLLLLLKPGCPGLKTFLSLTMPSLTRLSRPWVNFVFRFLFPPIIWPYFPKERHFLTHLLLICFKYSSYPHTIISTFFLFRPGSRQYSTAETWQLGGSHFGRSLPPWYHDHDDYDDDDFCIGEISGTPLDSYHCYHQIRKSKSCQISGGQPRPPPGAAALPHLENQLLQAECCRSSKGGIGTFSFVVMTMMALIPTENMTNKPNYSILGWGWYPNPLLI